MHASWLLRVAIQRADLRDGMTAGATTLSASACCITTLIFVSSGWPFVPLLSLPLRAEAARLKLRGGAQVGGGFSSRFASAAPSQLEVYRKLTYFTTVDVSEKRLQTH